LVLRKLHLLGGETLATELLDHPPTHLAADLLKRRRIEASSRQKAAPHVMVFDAGEQQTDSTEEARQPRHQDAADEQVLGQPSSVDRSRAAIGQRREATWVPAALGGHGPQGTHHARVGDAVDALGRLQEVHAHWFRDVVVHSAAGQLAIDHHLAACQPAGADVAETTLASVNVGWVPPRR
jgi:hypothetical protein